MSPRARRIIIPLLVASAAVGVLWAVITAPKNTSRTAAPTTQPSVVSSTTAAATQAGAEQVSRSETSAAPGPAAAPAPPTPFSTLRAIPPSTTTAEPAQQPTHIGSLDFRRHTMQLKMTHLGASIAEIAFSDIWETAEAKRKADEYRKQLPDNAPIDLTQLDQTQRYILQKQQPYAWNGHSIQVPVFAAHSVEINGTRVNLLQESAWAQTAPGRFETRIVDAADRPIAHITREFTLGQSYNITLTQQVRNLSDQTLEVRWQQYGPLDLKYDPSGYIDRRRFAFGYVANPGTQRAVVLSGEDDLDLDRSAAVKRHKKAIDAGSDYKKKLEQLTLWPNQLSSNYGYALSWFAGANRYFGLAIHPIRGGVKDQGPADLSLAGSVEEIRLVETPNNTDPQTLFTFLISPKKNIAPGDSASFDMGIYAGPLDRHVLSQPPYKQLAMKGLILYQIAGCCGFLTFQWLANLLLGFLSLLHDYILFDWGLAIIALVIVVRTLLHPLTKKSQVNMQRFGKKMSALKPDIDKIQKKYAGEPRKAQQEQMKLMRERGVNPLQMLGCLPMLLQTPIWIALWAMLYLAFDLRQQPAFYGLFQLFGGWSFMGDLSSQDQFINLGQGFTIPLLGWNITALNLLPILMSVVFYIQQKYLSPPPTPNMTPEQIQQQKIMKWMMVIMFPLMLYKQPSGLTLYIFTSTCIGILESRYIRRHVDQLDLNPPENGSGVRGPNDSSPKKPKDWRGRFFAQAIERAKAKRQAAQERTFKKRK